MKKKVGIIRTLSQKGRKPVSSGAPRRRDPLIRGQHAQNVFGGDDVVAFRLWSCVVDGCHLSRHSLSFIRLRRSQVRIVFNGTLKRAASSA